MALFDQLGIDLPLAARRVTSRGFAARAPYTPEEEDSLLSYFAGGGLSALEAIGNVLDTPGSFIRTALAGENPFPAIFDTSQRVSGRDLLEEWGMLGPNQVGSLDTGDVAGFAAEMAFDPLTYLTFGTSAALKPAGQIAKAIGKLPRRSILNPITGAVEQGVRATRMASGGLGSILKQTPDLEPAARQAATAMGYSLDDVLAEGGALSGQIGFGLPFRAPSATFNLPFGEQLAGGLDKVGAAIRTSRPGAAVSRMFDSAVRGAGTAPVQEALRGVSETTEGFRNALSVEEGLQYYAIQKNLPDLLTPEGQYDHDKLWDLIEGRDRTFQAQPKPLSVDATVDRVFPKANAEQRQFAIDMVTDLRGRYEKDLANLQSLGFADKEYAQPFAGTAYTHRQATDPDYFPGGGSSGERFVTDDQFGGRKIHAPTSLVNDALNDEKLHALMKDLPPRDVLREATETQVERLQDEFMYLDTDDLVQLQAAKMIRMGETGQDIDRAVWLKPAPPYLRQQVVDQALTHFGWGPAEKKYFAELKRLKKHADLGDDPTAIDEFTDIAAANLEGMEFQVKQAKMLARMNLARDEDLLKSATDFYSHDALRDSTRKQLADMERFQYGSKLQDLYAQLATPGAPGIKTPGMVKIADALKGMGMGGTLETEPAAIRSIATRLHAAGKLTDEQLNLVAGPHATAENGLAVLSGFEIPETIAADAQGFMSRMNAPDEVKGLLGMYDKWLNNFKANITAPFPSFHSRNLVSLFWQSVVAGGRDPRYGAFDPRAYSQPFLEMDRLLKGKVIEDAHTLPIFAGQNLTPRDATNRLRAIFAGHGVAMGQGNLATESTELLGGRGAVMSGGEISERLPGQVPMDPGPLGAKYAVEGIRRFFTKEGWNPLRTAGGPLGDEVDKFAPVAAGRKVATYFEDLGRGATMLAKLRQGYVPEMAAAMSQAAHVDYRRLRYTPFESQVMKRLVPFYCVPDDSEIMTRDGWKSCDDLVVGEEVLTYNVQDDCMEWQPCTDKAIFDHDQEIEVIQNRFQKIRCTSEHRWVVKNSRYPAKLAPYREITNHNMLRVAAPLRRGGDSLLTPKQARLLGWLLTDGSSRVRARSPQFVESVLYQHPNKFLSEVEEVAGNKATWFHPDSGTATISVEKNRKEELINLIGRDVLLKKEGLLPIIARLNYEAAKAMYDAMYKACGTVGTRTNDSFATERKGLKEAMQFLSYLLGKRSAENKRGVCISPRRGVKLEAKYRKKEHYKGRVWCPQTPNGTWLMRQGRFVGITGNTFSRGAIPYALRDLMEHPGGYNAQAVRLFNAGRDERGFLPPQVEGGLAMPLGEEENGMQRYLAKIDIPIESINEFGRLTPSISGTVETNLRGLIAQATPAIKTPIEMAFGKSAYQGRNLDRLDPLVGRIASNITGEEYPYQIPGDTILDAVLMASPVSRYVTTARQVTDPRKGMGEKAVNFFSGARLTNVDVEKARMFAAQDVIEQMLRQNPAVREYSRVYVPADQQSQLTPEESAALQIYQMIGQRLKERAEVQAALAP